MPLTPVVIEQTSKGERSYDIFSRLLKDRIIMLDGAIDERVSSVLCAQLLFLESQDAKKDITLYVNSSGGLVTAGMAIQPLGGASGQATDVEIRANELLRWKRELTEVYVQNTGKTFEELSADMERDKFMTPTEAVAYGLADRIVKSRAEDNQDN